MHEGKASYSEARSCALPFVLFPSTTSPKTASVLRSPSMIDRIVFSLGYRNRVIMGCRNPPKILEGKKYTCDQLLTWALSDASHKCVQCWKAFVRFIMLNYVLILTL